MREWYSTPAWRKLRRLELMKQPLCVHCDARGITKRSQEVDHVNGFETWDEFLSGPFQCLCTSCHARKTRRVATGRTGVGVDEQGRPVDPTHPWNDQRR